MTFFGQEAAQLAQPCQLAMENGALSAQTCWHHSSGVEM